MLNLKRVVIYESFPNQLKTNLNPVITTKTIKLIEQLQHSSLYLPVSTHFTAISHNMNHEVAEILYFFLKKKTEILLLN
jgi:hypothetical protein